MARHPAGVFLQVFLILILILPISRPLQADVNVSRSVEDAGKGVLSIRTYDWKGTFLREGMGYFSDQNGTITTVVPVLEGGYFVEAEAQDGTQYVIEKINHMSEATGLVFTRLEEEPEDFTSIDKVASFPAEGDKIWIPGEDSAGRYVLKRTNVLKVRPVPGLTRYLYMKTALPCPLPGTPVFNASGEAAGVVLAQGGSEHASLIVSTDMIRSSYGVSGEVISLLTWTDGLSRPWFEKAKGLYLKGFISFHAENYEQAVDHLERSTRVRDRESRRTCLLLGDCYRILGETQKAIENYERALSNMNKLNGYHLSLARMYLKQKRVTDARRIWEGVARHGGESTTSIIMAAWLLEATGNRKEALAAAMKAVENDAQNPTAQGTVGEILARQGRFEEAFLALERSISLDPQNSEFAGELCYAAVRSGRHSQAVEICGKVVRTGCEKAQNLVHLGDACAASGRDEKALESYRRAIKADPGSLQAWCRMGDLLARTGLHQEAVSLFLDALEVFPGSTWLHFKLGKVHGLMGDSDAAARQVQFLMDINQALADQLARRLVEGNETRKH